MTCLKKQAYTLIELLAVVLIIGVLTGIAFPQYVRSREKTIDKQAIAYLRAIQAAEKSYKLDTGEYFPMGGNTVSNVADINAGLDLDLVDDGTWDSITVITAGMTPAFRAFVQRNKGGFNRQWDIFSISGSEDPVCTPLTPSTVCP